MLVDMFRAVAIWIISVLVAVPMGILFGWLLSAVVNPRAFGWIIDVQISWQAIWSPCMWGLVAALIAGVVRIGQAEESLGDGAQLAH